MKESTRIISRMFIIHGCVIGREAMLSLSEMKFAPPKKLIFQYKVERELRIVGNQQV